MIILLSILAIITRMTALALFCTHCESSTSWTDCLRNSIVQNCNNFTAVGYNVPHYSPAKIRGRSVLGCFELLIKDNQKGTRRFVNGCTNDEDFCSAWDKNVVSVEQCLVCPKGDPDMDCLRERLVEEKFGKLRNEKLDSTSNATSTESTLSPKTSAMIAEGSTEQESPSTPTPKEELVSMELTTSQQTSTMTTQLLIGEEALSMQTSTEELRPVTTTTFWESIVPSQQSVTEENSSSNVTPGATLLVVAVTGAIFSRNLG